MQASHKPYNNQSISVGNEQLYWSSLSVSQQQVMEQSSMTIYGSCLSNGIHKMLKCFSDLCLVKTLLPGISILE